MSNINNLAISVNQKKFPYDPNQTFTEVCISDDMKKCKLTKKDLGITSSPAPSAPSSTPSLGLPAYVAPKSTPSLGLPAYVAPSAPVTASTIPVSTVPATASTVPATASTVPASTDTTKCSTDYPEIFNLLKDVDYVYDGSTYNKINLIESRLGVLVPGISDVDKFNKARDEFIAKLEYVHNDDPNKRTIKGVNIRKILIACHSDKQTGNDEIKRQANNVFTIASAFKPSASVGGGNYYKKYLKYKSKYMELKAALNH